MLYVVNVCTWYNNYIIEIIYIFIINDVAGRMLWLLSDISNDAKNA